MSCLDRLVCWLVGSKNSVGVIDAVVPLQVWVIYGDGSLGYSVAEFDTFTRHKVQMAFCLSRRWFVVICASLTLVLWW